MLLGNSCFMPIDLCLRFSGSKRLVFTLVWVLAVSGFLLHQFGLESLQPRSTQIMPPVRNETLGFGAIYVLTEDDTTWRVQGLRRAAKLTGLQLKAPVQRHIPDDGVYAYLDGETPITKLDEIRAVLNYKTLLETFIKSGYETALIVEDDVDFGLDIQSQMEIISNVIESYYLGLRGSNAGNQTGEEILGELVAYPYGKDIWDVFWIGHYGVEFTSDPAIIHYDDPYALPWQRLTSNFNNYYESLRPDEEHPDMQHQQQIMIGSAPMGTYAFAVTREAAEAIVRDLRTDPIQQFDYALHRKCKSETLRCIAPVPTLMHHHRVMQQNASSHVQTKFDLKWWRSMHKYTYNIEWSARCNAERVGERLGDRWQCMPGRYDADE